MRQPGSTQRISSFTPSSSPSSSLLSLLFFSLLVFSLLASASASLCSGKQLQSCCIENLNGCGGCSDPSIQACVCDLDPSCCEDVWDSLCVTLATSECTVSSSREERRARGEGLIGRGRGKEEDLFRCEGQCLDFSCREASACAGCNSVAVEKCVCEEKGRKGCCETQWGEICVQTALEHCSELLPDESSSEASSFSSSSSFSFFSSSSSSSLPAPPSPSTSTERDPFRFVISSITVGGLLALAALFCIGLALYLMIAIIKRVRGNTANDTERFLRFPMDTFEQDGEAEDEDEDDGDAEAGRRPRAPPVQPKFTLVEDEDDDEEEKDDDEEEGGEEEDGEEEDGGDDEEEIRDEEEK
ncbi:U3 small nucleolar ribonucleoprotein MPP10 [Balamuthia mandrillaris]